MNELSQLATALVAIIFAATLLATGHLFTQYRSARNPAVPPLATVHPDKVTRLASCEPVPNHIVRLCE
jgi:hypothetical protein